MGFGLLLIGYIIAYVSAVGYGPYLFAGLLIGGVIMFLGLRELRKYAPTFVYAIVADTLLLICALYGLLVWMETQLSIPIGVQAWNLGVFFDWAEIVIGFVFNIAMLYGIADLSRRVEYPDTRVKAYRNMIFVVLFNVLQVVLTLPIKALDKGRSSMLVVLLIFQLAYTVINAILIFKCYAMICPEGQEDMKRKKSRFEFVNKINKIHDERDEQVIEGTKKYFEDRLNKKNQKSKSHNKSKKKKK